VLQRICEKTQPENAAASLATGNGMNMERENIPADEDPRYYGIKPEDLERWQYVCKRFEVPAAVTVTSNRPRLVITLPRNDGKGTFKQEIRSLESFVFNFLDAYCYHLKPFSLNYDKFLPRFAKFKEKEIHPWIKRYKEED
jgi:hypothetical protein